MSEETYQRNGLTVTIHNDTDTRSPRGWYNVGKMICSHRNYHLGDEQFEAYEYEGWDDLKQHLIKERNAVIVLPLGLYDHSGITMYVSDTHNRWDGGQVGFIYCTQEDIDREWSGDNVQAEKYLRGEVETYDQYLRGDVYGYSTTDPLNGNVIDTCWGFYGIDCVREEANNVADSYEHPKRELIHYEAFKELFKALGVNPLEFKLLSEGRIKGHFPDMPERDSLINVGALARVLWGEK
jgi:hypothetical protein